MSRLPAPGVAAPTQGRPRKTRWLVWLLVPALMVLCIGLTVYGPVVKTLIRGISFEVRCWQSEVRSECLRLQHQQSEARSLKAIEDELLQLGRDRQDGRKP